MACFLPKSILEKLKGHQYHPPDNENEDNNQIPKDPLLLNGRKVENLSEEMICRVCMRSACTPILEQIGEYDILTGIRLITSITISIDDCFPKFICTECLDILKSSLELRKVCEDSDIKYRRILDPLYKYTRSLYPYSKTDFQLILHQMKVKRLNAVSKQLTKQKKEQQKRRKKKIKPKKFPCKPCSISFKTQEKLEAHRRQRRCTRHPCPLCGKLVLSVEQHKRQMHQKVAHECETCGKTFPIIARLKSHMLVHKDTFNFFCDLCPYKSKHKYYLVMHMRTHTGEKPYQCTQCSATFVNPSNYNKHKLTHQAKKFTCAICEKLFRSAPALREHHNATHMNQRHCCQYCGRGFAYKSDLRKHEIKKHNRAKRIYKGGEPTYVQVERLQKLQENAKWREQTELQTSTVQSDLQYIEHKDYGSSMFLYPDVQNHVLIPPHQEPPLTDNLLLKKALNTPIQQPPIPALIPEFFIRYQ